MRYRYQKVDAKITDYVRTVLVLEEGSNSESSDLPLVTNGMPALLCRTKNDNCQITLFGRSVPNEAWTIENDTTHRQNSGQALIAFFFKPFALGTAFKLSAQKLKDRPIALNLWNAQKTMALNLQLLNAKLTEDKIKLLSHFIFTQIHANQRECELIRYATDKLMENSGADTLSQLLQDLRLTERTFQRIFKKYVGISPNQYRRICQFQFAFSQLKGGHFDKQTDVAYANGYFDQSHYIRSFKEFTDTTPNEYLQNGLPLKVE